MGPDFEDVIEEILLKTPQAIAKVYLDDLLSMPDLAAGMLQDLLTAHDIGSDIPGGDEKLAVLK